GRVLLSSHSRLLYDRPLSRVYRRGRLAPHRDITFLSLRLTSDLRSMAAQLSVASTADDVGKWLESNGLSEYKAKFIAQKVNGEAFAELTEVDLERKELAVSTIGDRKR